MGLFCSTKVDAPAPRDLGAETEDIIKANLKYAPQQYASEAILRPKYAALDRKITQENLFNQDNGILKQGLDAVDMLAQSNRLANTAQREADLKDATELGADQLALQKSLNPEVYDLMTQLDTMAFSDSGAGAAEQALARSLGVGARAPLRGGSGTSNRVDLSSIDNVDTVGGPREVSAAGPSSRIAAAQVSGDLSVGDVGDVATRGNSGVLQTAADRAQADLARGGELDAGSRMMIEQSVLENMNKMGRAADNRSMAAIATELDKASEQRLDSRFGRALQTESALQGQQGMDVATERGNQSSRLQQAGLGLEADMANLRTVENTANRNLEADMANLSAEEAAAARALDAGQANQNADLATKELNTRINQGNQDASIAEGQLQIGASQVNQGADSLYRDGLKDLALLETARGDSQYGKAQQAVNNRLATIFDPTLGVLGRPSVNQSNFTQQRANGNFSQTPTGAFDIFNNYAAGMNSDNYNAANANARQNAATNVDMWGAGMGLVGSLAGI